jgi:hypothetical protein
MKHAIRALVLLVLILGFTAPAGAQLLGDGLLYQDDPETVATQGGHYYYCAAKGSWGGRCRACVTAANGIRTCGDAEYNAKCECKGNCSTYYGTCTYEP